MGYFGMTSASPPPAFNQFYAAALHTYEKGWNLLRSRLSVDCSFKMKSNGLLEGHGGVTVGLLPCNHRVAGSKFADKC